MTTLSAEQYAWLTAGIDRNRVRQLKGQSHLEAWDVRRTLIRIFGFGGFDIKTKSLDLVREMEYPPGTITYKNRDGTERKNERTAWTVIYRAEVRLVIKVGGAVLAVFEDGAAGDSQNQPVLGDAHDHAMKTALSQALKRCVVNLGDQFGLSLYNGGNPNPVVLRSLVAPAGAVESAPPAEEAPVQPELPRALPEDEPAPADAAEASEDQYRAYEDLSQLVAVADSVESLKAAWEAVVEAFGKGEITQLQGNRLRSAIGERRNEVVLAEAVAA